MQTTQKEEQKLSDEAHEYLSNFCHDYCKDEDDRKTFFFNLNKYLNAEIELEKFCNQ